MKEGRLPAAKTAVKQQNIVTNNVIMAYSLRVLWMFKASFG